MMEGLLFSNIAASVATVFVLVLRRLFGNKIFSKIFVLLWILVIIRLLLPFEFSSAVSVYSPIREQKTGAAETEIVLHPAAVPEKEVFIGEHNTEAAKEIKNNKKAEISSEKILLSIWISGAVAVGGFFAAKHFFAVKKIMRSAVLSEKVPPELKAGKIRFYKSKNLCSPLSFGILRPAVVVPEDTNEDQLSFVLLHEYTHVKDRDAVIKAAAIFALSLNWFNPFSWLMVKYLDRDIERYCDERVLEKTGKEKAFAYAGTILDFAEKESLSLNYFSAASLCERVTSIMKNKDKKRNLPAAIFVFAAVMILMAACGTVPEEKEASSDAKELLELIENASWEKTGEYTELIEIENEKLGSFILSKESFSEKVQSCWDFSHLPVKRIIIKDLEIKKEGSAEVVCHHSDVSSLMIVYDYKTLLEKGFKIEYEQGDITVSSEKPLGNMDFSMEIMADLEKIEVVSEKQEINYMGFEPKRDTDILGYYGDENEPPNNYLTDSFEYRNSHEIKTLSIENFGFSDPSLCDIYVYDSDEFFITVTYGDELRASGFNVSILEEGNVVVSTARENKDISEKFHMEIYMDLDSVDLQYEDVTVTKVIPVEEFHTGTLVENNEKIEVDTEFLWPTEEGYICSAFGSYKGHTGVDIMPEGGKGSEVYAAASGTVVKSKFGATGYGYHIIIDHGNGIQTLYAHCGDLFVKAGDTVEAGDVIASVGSTGNSTGTHLHFEIRINGAYVNPEHYISES